MGKKPPLIMIGASMVLSGLIAAGPGRAQNAREVGLIERLAARLPQPPETPGGGESLDRTLAASRTVDEFLQVQHEQAKVKANSRAMDSVFLRRVYLDIVGRVPSLAETVAFLKNGDARKRSRLIDRLLKSEGYVSNQFNFWADILRVQTNMRNTPGIAYVDWLKQSLRENKPYDKFVHGLLTSNGFVWEDGAAGYFVRDDGMPLDNLANTTRIFLGTRVECAQCHDHPFDKWTQMEFYELAAFTYGTETRMRGNALPSNLRAAQKQARDPMVRRALNDLTRALTYGVNTTGRRLRLPHDYKYDDGKPKEMVDPLTIFGDEATPTGDQTHRDAFANWVASPSNPRFTKVIANRLWKKVMGVGLVEPIDDFTDATKPLNPELLDFLTEQMIAYDYDMKQFMRMLYNTQAYQRNVMLKDHLDTEPWQFAGPQLKRMTAEQFWDSIMTLVVPNIDQRKGDFTRAYSYLEQAKRAKDMPASELVAMATKRAEFLKKEQDLQRRLREADSRKDMAAAKSLRDQLNQTRRAYRNRDYMAASPPDDSRWKGYNRSFVRASEINSPANFGHFLRQFGQSDREIIENANMDPNMIQVLTMFNGRLFNEVIADNSQLMKNIASEKSPKAKVQIIFLSLLNRLPTAGEMNFTLKSIRRGDNHDYGKVVWALLNTRQFSFVQ